MDMNYRASCRARSHAEFTAKLGLVAEEADETSELTRLRGESRELLAIFSASVGTARRKQRRQ